MKEKNSTTFLNDSQQVEIFLYAWRIIVLDTEYRISVRRIDELKSLKAQDVLLVQIESNFNFKKLVLKLARSPCHIVRSCE